MVWRPVDVQPIGRDNLTTISGMLGLCLSLCMMRLSHCDAFAFWFVGEIAHICCFHSLVLRCFTLIQYLHSQQYPPPYLMSYHQMMQGMTLETDGLTSLATVESSRSFWLQSLDLRCVSCNSPLPSTHLPPTLPLQACWHK